MTRYKWRPGYSLARKPVRKRRPVPREKNGYTFIVEYPNVDYEDRIHRDDEDIDVVEKESQHSQSASLGDVESILSWFDASESQEAESTVEEPIISATSAALDDALPLQILHASVAAKYRPVFDQCMSRITLMLRQCLVLNTVADDAHFCKIPLTFDMLVNPFQCTLSAEGAPPSLLHAVMALGSHHMENDESELHRQAAVHSLHQSIGHLSASDSVRALSLLDPILLLFSLDETRSALGNWLLHLRGAFGLLETVGGVWTLVRRVVAQVGILVWWDAIIALVSRQGCVFPYTYLENVIEHSNEDDWTFMGLCGCPRELVSVAVQLAHLAGEKTMADKMRFVAFDSAAIARLESFLKSLHYTTNPTIWTNAEAMHHDVDKLHCSEAWRHGLLLYIFRVFHWKPGDSVSFQQAYHARQVIDHVFACRQTGYLAKQTIFPLFLAGSEICDISERQRIAEFCDFWSKKTRFFMIDSVMPLLRDVWTAQETQVSTDVSWWTVIDRRHAVAGRESDSMTATFCFG